MHRAWHASLCEYLRIKREVYACAGACARLRQLGLLDSRRWAWAQVMQFLQTAEMPHYVVTKAWLARSILEMQRACAAVWALLHMRMRVHIRVRPRGPCVCVCVCVCVFPGEGCRAAGSREG